MSSWRVRWGDGTANTYAGPAVTATHTYTVPGLTNDVLVSAVDEDGVWFDTELVVSGFGSGALHRYDTQGAHLQTFGSAAGAFDTVIGPDGLLYVSSYGTDSVHRFDPADGALVDTFVAAGSGGLDGPTGLAFGPTGTLLVGSNLTDQVLAYDPSTGAPLGVFVAAGNGLDGIGGMTVGTDGNLYVAGFNSNTVHRYNATTGAFVSVFVAPGSGSLLQPEGLVFAADGSLLVASKGNHRVTRYDGTTGAFLGNFVASGSGGLNQPVGLRFGADGHLYVSSSGSDQILRYDGSTGAFVDVFVTASSGGVTRPYGLVFRPTAQVSVTAPALVVNSTGDVSDNNAGNGVCDTGASIGGNPECTLRAAIQESNARAGADTVHFDIPAALVGGTHLIAPSSALPAVTDPLAIDAATEPDFLGTPMVTLSGQNSGFVTGLALAAGADRSLIRGLVIRDWGLDGIQAAPGNDRSVISGNYIGQLNVAGTSSGAGTGNGQAGIWVRGTNLTIGGSPPIRRNVISGNGTKGIVLTGEGVDGTRIEGNTIGVTAVETALLNNGDDAIRIENGADDTVILDNVMAHPNGDGIEITGASTGTVIQGNVIGTDRAGTAVWSGRFAAISLELGAADTLIGGTDPGDGNVIANAGTNAGNPNSISIWPDAGSGISIVGNSIRRSRGIGIDLNPIGVTANDPGDGDSGPNDLLNTPVIGSATSDGATVAVVFDLDVPVNADGYRVEFFTNPSGENLVGRYEGESLASSVNVTPGTGLMHSFAAVPGSVITATATRIDVDDVEWVLVDLGVLGTGEGAVVGGHRELHR